MSLALFGTAARCAAALTVGAAFLAAPALADFDPPQRPKIDCTKPGNQNKPACKNRHGELSDDEIYNAAYWLARHGQYREALALAARGHNENDPRLLLVKGFATRKLGDVEAALPFYAKALAINPNSTLAREYLGEAFLSKGDVASAKAQLGEIETRCGRTCSGYAELAQDITSYAASHPAGG